MPTTEHRQPPREVAALLAFVNTVDVEDQTDSLTTPAELTRWLWQHAGLAQEAAAGAAHLRLARDLRRGLRALLLLNNGGSPRDADLVAGARAAGKLPLRLELTRGKELVAPADLLRSTSPDPVLAALAGLAANYAVARLTGRWHRLRRCPREDCAWVFWDSSPRGDRRWCTMRVCGNRAKARSYAQRRRTGEREAEA